MLIHEVGVHVGFPFFVLEYAEGGSLAEKIRAQPMRCDWTAHVTLQNSHWECSTPMNEGLFTETSSHQMCF